MSRSKYWVFTINNYNDLDESTIHKSCEGSDISYLIYGKEIGESGTPHLQGYVEFHARVRMRRCKDLISNRGHFEVRRGSGTQAREYCLKDGQTWEFGDFVDVRQGQRTDLEELRRALSERVPMVQIADDHFGSYLRFQRGIQAYRNLLSDKRLWESEVFVYWGTTGTGKTRAVYELAPDCWSYPCSGWFDGYDGQDDVLFDDFSGSEFKLNYLLKLLDRYPMMVPVKGGFVNWKPRRIFITSNLDPRTWYSGAHMEHQDALMRRLGTIVHYQNYP